MNGLLVRTVGDSIGESLAVVVVALSLLDGLARHTR